MYRTSPFERWVKRGHYDHERSKKMSLKVKGTPGHRNFLINGALIWENTVISLPWGY